MERKTMGGFIAALRKANGMTQKELAEKLNVSDKSVSRWERDDGAPDLSLIPVIAEIFGVTCDELLRGERQPAGERETDTGERPASPKSEKQRKRLLAVSLSKYKTRSLIAAGLAVAGLIAAMAGNFAFYRAYIGFAVAAVFALAAVICQAIFVNSAFLSVANEEVSGAEVDRFKCSVVRMAEGVIVLTVVLLAFSLPLGIYPHDAYMGLQAQSWFPYGGIMALLALALCAVVCWFLNASLLNRGLYPLSEQEERVWRQNRALKRRCAVGLLIALAVTWGAHIVAIEILWTAANLAEKMVFDDYDSFVTFMEQDVRYEYGYGYVTVEPSSEQAGPAIWYDEFGNEISEEEALRETLTDGEGNVLCEYVRRNQRVAMIRHDDGGLPITVFTMDALQEGTVRQSVINAAFIVLYFVEAAAALAVYFKRRAG